jgi:hypothetical protein
MIFDVNTRIHVLSLCLLPLSSPLFFIFQVQHSLRSFLTPEVLSGANAYRCGACNNKCDADKGYILLPLPRRLAAVSWISRGSRGSYISPPAIDLLYNVICFCLL